MRKEITSSWNSFLNTIFISFGVKRSPQVYTQEHPLCHLLRLVSLSLSSFFPPQPLVDFCSFSQPLFLKELAKVFEKFPSYNYSNTVLLENHLEKFEVINFLPCRPCDSRIFREILSEVESSVLTLIPLVWTKMSSCIHSENLPSISLRWRPNIRLIFSNTFVLTLDHQPCSQQNTPLHLLSKIMHPQSLPPPPRPSPKGLFSK